MDKALEERRSIMSKIWKSAKLKLLSIGLIVGVLFSTLSPINISVNNPLNKNRIDFTLGYVQAAWASGTIDQPLTQVGIQAALNALPSVGGRIYIMNGSYNTVNFTGTVSRAIPGVTLVSSGAAITLQNNGVTPLFSTGGQTGWVFENIVTDAGGVTLSSDTVLNNVRIGTTLYAIASTGLANVSTGRNTGYVIASADAPSLARQQADLVVPASGWETPVQTALTNNSGNKITFFGTFTKSTVAGLSFGSNTTIDNQGIFTFITNVGNGATVFTPTTNSTGWSIVNGIIDGNKANQPKTWRTNEQIAISTTNVSNAKIDTLIQNFYGENIKETNNGYGNLFVNRAYPKSVQIPERTINPNLNKVNLINSFDSGWTLVAGDSLTYNTSSFVDGTASADLLLAVGATGNISKTGTWSFPANAQFGVMGRVYSSDLAGFSTLRLVMLAPDAANSITMWYSRGVGRIWTYGDDWRVFGFNQGNATLVGSPNLANVTQINLIAPAGAGSATRIYFDKLFWNLPSIPGGLLTIAADDGNTDTITTLKPIMDNYGYKGVTGVNGASVGASGKMTMTQLRTLQDAGWEIGNHAYGHENSYSQPKSVIEDGLRKNQDLFLSNGLGSGTYWIGTNDQGLDYVSYPVVSKYMTSARTRGSDGTASVGWFANNFPTFDRYAQFNINYLGSATDVTNTMALLDQVAQYGLWVQIYVHSVAGYTTNITSLFNKAQTLGIRVVTYNEALQLAEQANIYSSGNTTIPSGSTSVVVPHYFNSIPSEITIIPTNSTTNVTRHWKSSVNSSNFTINVNVDPGVSGATFDWVVK